MRAAPPCRPARCQALRVHHTPRAGCAHRQRGAGGGGHEAVSGVRVCVRVQVCGCVRAYVCTQSRACVCAYVLQGPGYV